MKKPHKNKEMKATFFIEFGKWDVLHSISNNALYDVKWKSNAISGFKVSFFRQNAKEFCSCQKISKANNWISFLGKYEIDDDKKGGFFFTFYWIGEDQCKKKYLICILHCNRNQKMGSTY